jgi:hypothetical protein
MPALSAAERRIRLAEFIPDTEVRRDLGKTKMCLSRWDRHPEKAPPGWPAKIRIGRRNFRHRPDYEAFVAGLINAALAKRELALERAGARRSRERPRSGVTATAA